MPDIAAIYCRVSTKEQALNESLGSQKKECFRYCQSNGMEVGPIFVDEGESAKTAARPQFQAMLKYCRENKDKVRYVIVYSLSRFSRNTQDHLVIRGLLAGWGISLRSVSEAIDDSSTGKLMETILAGFAQFDNDVKAERTKLGMKATIQGGRWPWNARLGFLRNKAPKGQANVIPDPERAPLVKKAFELVATGLYTRPQVLKMVNDMGLRTVKGNPVGLQTFEDMLRCSLYAGIMKSALVENPEKGSFEPIISVELFEKVQAVLDGRKHQITPYQRNHPDFPLRQFTHCAICNHPLTGSWSKGRSKKYAYYRCKNSKCKFINIKKVDLENIFIDYLKELEPTQEYLELFKAIVLDRWEDAKGQSEEQCKAIEKRLQELKTHRQKLVNAVVEKLIDKVTYDEQKDKLNQEIAVAELDAHQAKLETFDIEGVLNFAQYVIGNASRLWADMKIDQKQRFQKILFPKNVIFDGEKFGTVETCIFFKQLQISTAPESRMASSTGFEPVSLE